MPVGTPCQPRCDGGRAECTSHGERAAEDRGRKAPHRSTRSPVTLSPAGLDIDWELNAWTYTHSTGLAALFADLGIRHLRTRPRRPQTNGKAERFIGTIQREWAYARLFRSNAERLATLPAGSTPTIAGVPTPGSWPDAAIGSCQQGRRERQLDRLRSLPVFTKWGLSLPANQAHLAQRLAGRGSRIRALWGYRALSHTLRGADFVGYDHLRGTWIACEAKGSFGQRPSDAAAQRAQLSAPSAAPRIDLPALARHWQRTKPRRSLGRRSHEQAPQLHNTPDWSWDDGFRSNAH